MRKVGVRRTVIRLCAIVALAVALLCGLERLATRVEVDETPRARWFARSLLLMTPARSVRVAGPGYQLTHMADDPAALSDRLARQGWRERADEQLGGARYFHRGSERLTVYSRVDRVFMECSFRRP